MYVVRGTASVNELALIEGDGLSFIQESSINIDTDNETEIILFDLKPE
jgi:redox-sensitive bicupin YhaK (pirin superfamily)